MTELPLTLSILALVSVIVVLVVLRERDHDRWAVERKDLMDRWMSKDWPQYMALKHAEKEAEEEKKPVELTKDYDKAWSA